MKLYAIEDKSVNRNTSTNASLFLHRETAKQKCPWYGSDIREINIEDADICGKYVFRVFGYYGYRYNFGLPANSDKGITDVVYEKYYTNIKEALADPNWVKAEDDVLHGKSMKKTSDPIHYIYTLDRDSNPFRYGEHGEGYYMLINKIRVFKY